MGDLARSEECIFSGHLLFPALLVRRRTANSWRKHAEILSLSIDQSVRLFVIFLVCFIIIRHTAKTGSLWRARAVFRKHREKSRADGKSVYNELFSSTPSYVSTLLGIGRK